MGDELDLMCPSCAVSVKGEREANAVHPDWCRQCEGYSVAERGIRHSRKWAVAGVVAVRDSLLIRDDGNQEARCVVDEMWGWTAEEGRQIAAAMLEAAELIEGHDLDTAADRDQAATV